MADVFISYSRADKDFVRMLHYALAKLNRETWVDWEGIPLTAEWLKEIYAGIEAADNFIFVISPESVASDACLKEVAYASENNKRLIPIFHRAVPEAAIPEALARINFIFLRDSDDFESTFASLVEAIDTDLEWKRVHTRLLVRAKDWERERRDKSYLLRGKDLREAEDWQSRCPSTKLKATSLHSEYIVTSRRAEIHRKRITLGTALVACLVAVGLAVIAGVQRSTARREATIAQGRQLATLAESLRAKGPAFTYPAIILALESVSREPSPGAELVLSRALGSWRLLSEVKVGEEASVGAVAFSPDARLLASGTAKEGIILVSDVTTGREVARLPEKPFAQLPFVALRFSPDGRWLATAGGADGTVSVWDSRTFNQVASLENGGLPAVAVAFSADSQWLATGGLDGSARVWRTGSWNFVARLRHDLFGSVQGISKDVRTPAQQAVHFVTAMAFSPDTLRLATSSDDGSVALWEVGTWKSLARFRRDLARGVSVFSSDLKWLAYIKAGKNNTALALDAGTGKVVSSFRSNSQFEEVAFSPDGGWLVTTTEDGSAQVWSVLSGDLLTQIPPPSGTALFSRPLSVAFTPDGGQIVIGSEDHNARILDSGTGHELATLALKEGFVDSVAFSSDGRKLATGSGDGRARVWEPPQAVARLQGTTRGTDRKGGVFSPDFQKYAAGQVLGNAVLVWETTTGKELLRFKQDHPTGVAFSPDGRLLGSEGLGGLMQVWDVNTATMVSERQFSGCPGIPMVFGPNSRWVASCTQGGRAVVWEAATGQDVAHVQHEDEISGIDFSSDSRWLATASHDGTARVSEAATGKLAATLPLGDKGTKEWLLHFSPDSHWLVTVLWLGGSGSWLWEVATGKLVARLEDSFVGFSPDSRLFATIRRADTFVTIRETSTSEPIAQLRHKGPVSTLAFSSDSRLIATGVENRTVIIWQLEGAKQVREFPAGSVNHVLFSPDSRFVAAASEDGSVRVWNVDKGEEIMRAEHGEAVSSLGFTTDGRFLAIGGESAVDLHPLRPEDSAKRACSYLSRNLSPVEWQEYLRDIPYRRTCPNLP